MKFTKDAIAIMRSTRNTIDTMKNTKNTTPTMKSYEERHGNYKKVNAVIDDASKEIVFRDYVDISVAVASPRGLVVPVLRNVRAAVPLQVCLVRCSAFNGALSSLCLDMPWIVTTVRNALGTRRVLVSNQLHMFWGAVRTLHMLLARRLRLGAL